MRTKKPSYPNIMRIEVERLFGQYTYDLTSTESVSGAQNLLLLYGDNGSGKTTIIRLLFHLLSQADVRGHRTYIAKTLFKKFSVTFSNRVTISAFRHSNKLAGPYTLISKIDGEDSYEVQVKTQADGSVISGDVDNRKLSKVFSRLSDPPLISYFLSDNRIFQCDLFDDDEYDEWGTSGAERIIRRQGSDAFERIVIQSPSRQLDVESSIMKAEAWMKRQAIASSRIGEETSSNIYIDILKRIAATPKKQDNKAIITGEDLLSSIKKLHTGSQSIVELGLTSQIPADALIKILSNVDQDRLSLIANVLEPYIDSVKARFDALAEIGRLLRTFLKIINIFYKRKTVSLTIRDGIRVCTDNNKVLEFNALSSGEKQLLLLLCNILVGTSQPSLFIIDEPEISLNVKWQRKLISSLLELVHGSQVQFVMATHSIELLTQHKDCVARLEDKTQKV